MKFSNPKVQIICSNSFLWPLPKKFGSFYLFIYYSYVFRATLQQLEQCHEDLHDKFFVNVDG